jgi:hypothetical protein
MLSERTGVGGDEVQWFPASVHCLLAACLVGAPIVMPPESAAREAMSSAVPLSPCYSSDHGKPDLLWVWLDRSRVDVSRRRAVLVVRAELTDTGGPGSTTGVARASVIASSVRGGAALQARLTDVGNGVWQGSIRIPRRATPGQWAIQLAAGDRAENWETWTSDALAQLGQSNSFDVTSRRDLRPPVVVRWTQKPERIDARTDQRRVTLVADVRDGGSGVASVSGELSQRAGSPRGWLDFKFRKVAGSRYEGRWRAHVRIPAWAPAGRWDPHLSVSDFVDRSRTYDRSDPFGSPGGKSRLSMTPIRVISGVDTEPPVVHALEASRGEVDLRSGPADVTVTLHAGDATSGLAQPSLSAERQGLEMIGPFHLVSGTLKNGIWQAKLHLAPCQVPAGTWILRPAFIRDRAGNYAEPRPELASQIQVINNDVVRPTGTAVPDSSSVTFSEPVVGIASSSAAVRTFSWGRGLPNGLAIGPDIPGSWQCASPDGTAIDCTGGPVQRATFVPLVALAPGQYGFFFNPEHVLSVTDLSGNPISSTWPVTFAVPQ